MSYFFMVAGCEDLIKPDRMIRGYIESILHRKSGIDECQALLTGAVDELKAKFPHLTPRLLDQLIWRHQRRLGGKSGGALRCVKSARASGATKGGRRVKFWEAIRELRRKKTIPKQWSIRDLAPFLRGAFADNTIATVPFNQSETRNGKAKGNYVKKGRRAEAFRVGPGLFELIDDPGD